MTRYRINVEQDCTTDERCIVERQSGSTGSKVLGRYETASEANDHAQEEVEAMVWNYSNRE